MFRPGRIIQIGGNSNGAIIVDINGLLTPLTRSRPSMSDAAPLGNADDPRRRPRARHRRQHGRAISSSASTTAPRCGIRRRRQWTVGPSAVNARLYHGNALLLPDASVLVSGGGAPGPLVNLNAEIYYPSYLYDASGAFAARPTITAYPSTLDVGTHFSITTGGAGTSSA